MSAPASIGEPLRGHIESVTGRPTGLNEAPSGASTPFFTVRPISGPEMTGDMATPNSEDPQVFSIDIVGTTMEQVDEAELRMVTAMDSLRASVTGVMGPPSIRRNGSGREDDRTYRAMVILTIPVTGT